jgi:hypothetical protein
VVRTEGIVGGDDQPDRRIDLGYLLQDDDIIDVGVAAARVLGRDDDSQQAQLGQLPGQNIGPLGFLIGVLDERLDLLLGEMADRFLETQLIFREREIHGPLLFVRAFFPSYFLDDPESRE